MVCVLLVPPLAPLVWIGLGGPDRTRFLRSWLVRIGIALMVLAPLPLMSVIIASEFGWSRDANPNPIGFGLLFVALTVVATVLLTAGTLLTELAIRRSR